MRTFARRYFGMFLLGASLITLRGAGQGAPSSQDGSALQVTFGPNGLQTLSYAGVSLADLGAHPGDQFYVGHMKLTDAAGNVLQGGQYGWGEVNSGKRWDAASHTWLYTFNWGTLAVSYAQTGNELRITTTVANKSDSGVTFAGASVFPAVLHFPQLPANFGAPNYPQIATNTTGPSVTVADWGSGEVAAVAPDASKPLYSGFWPAPGSGGVVYAPEISGTTPDGLATFLPHNDRPVAPGQTEQYTVALRFAPSGTSPASLAPDAYASWAQVYPPTLNWADRRAIGTVYLASSPQGGGDASRPGGFPTNPRRYFNSASVDVVSPSGLLAFQQQILAKANEVAANSRQLNAQGVITWDIEGEQYPQATSYVCEPDAIATVAPEMDTVVSLPDSPWKGKKLDDAYFGILKAAGLRVGVCLRPQHFTLKPDGSAEQVYLSPDAIVPELIRKARYAHDRWGATLFYVDSTVDSIGSILPAATFQQVAAALPDSLFIPEETTPLHYAYTAPFKSFIDLGAVGTDPATLGYYPHAFSAVLVNDASASKLAAAQAQLVQQVRQGDILMAHVDYWQDNNPVIVAIYQAAGVAAPTPAPTPSPTPTPQPDPTPTAGPAPDPGPTSGPAPDPTPTQPVATAPLPDPTPAPSPDPNPAPAPAPAPAPENPPSEDVAVNPISIAYPNAGQAVSGAIAVQGVVNDMLDAAGSYLIVDGYDLVNTRLTGSPYTYKLDTTTLPNGIHTLQLWGHDIQNNTLRSATVSVTVSN